MAEFPDLRRTEAAVIERTNAFRQSQGLDKLARNDQLDKAARQFARFLADSGRFAHDADGRQPADRGREAGYWHCTIAENLALNLDSRGFTVKRLADEVVTGWQQSSGHRRNMLLPHKTEIGVGIAQAKGEPRFLTVQLLGRPLGLAYEFRVVNRSPAAVPYSFAGRSHRIEPRMSATHRACEPGELRFPTAGRTGAQRTGSRYRPENNATFTLHGTSDGEVRVEAEPRR